MRSHLQRPRFLAAALAGAALAALGVAGSALSRPAVFPATNGRIVYQATVGDHVQLFTVRPDGTDVRQITNGTAEDDVAGSWSPSGKRIVFERDLADGSTQLAAMHADGSHMRTLAPAGFDFTPAYSPDGHDIAFERATDKGDGVWVMTAHGHHPHEITHNPPAGADQCLCDESPVFSPDGRRIAFVRVIDDLTTAVFVVDSDGRHLRQLTPWSLGVSSKLDWAPDGSRLLVSSPQQERPGASNLITIRVGNGAVTQLTFDTTPGIRNLADSFSPDGRKIVFARDGGDGLQLYVMSSSGGPAVQITHGNSAHWATWGPQANTFLAAAAAPELATSNFNTRQGKLSALRARVPYQASSFPIALRVTAPDGTWDGSQWTTGSHGVRNFGWVALGHGGTNPTILPEGVVTMIAGLGATPSVRATVTRLRSGGSGVTYGAAKAVRVNGLSGLAFDGDVWGKFGHTFVAFSPTTGGASPPDSWHLQKGESFRAIVVKAHGKTVLLFLESFGLSKSEFTGFVASANRLFQGLRFPG